MSPRTVALWGCACALAALLWSGASLAGPYRLPWAPTVSMELTQDCNDSEYADHIGTGSFAWDFANGTHFAVRAARAGVVTHLKMSSRSGCNTIQCVDEANYIVVDHGDGTASVYLHVDAESLDPQIRCGQAVAQGQHLADAGSTGWSTGPHLHYQVNPVHPDGDRTCECGPDGKGCPANYAAWSLFWSNKTFPSQPVTFDEWPATSCADRRMPLPVSQNEELPIPAPQVTASGALAPKQIASVPSRPDRATRTVVPRPPSAVGGRRSTSARPPHRKSSKATGKSGSPKRETHRPSKKGPSSGLPRH